MNLKNQTYKSIQVVAYDDQWPKLFDQEAQRIKSVLAANHIAIHHVGSTAVVGLAAKPKLDIVAVVKDITKTIAALESIGYQYKGEWNIPGKYGFTKRGQTNINLHVYPDMHPETECNLLFRDYLRDHPEVRDEYAGIKQSILKDPESMRRVDASLGFPVYTLEKGMFIQKVLRQAGFERERILKPTMEQEWAYLKTHVSKLSESYVICYRGVDMIGYAVISSEVQIVLEESQDCEAIFRRLIDAWLCHRTIENAK